MAGIGFNLKALFSKDTFIDRTKAYVYSAMIAAGPWISAVLVVNILMLVAERFVVIPAERFLFMSTIVYSFIFSQIITAPWQYIITRYVADKLFNREYAYIQPAFAGLSKVVFTIALLVSVAFYYDKPLPLYYIYMAGSLFLLLSLIWIIMVFLSAAKSYALIAKAFLIGGTISAILTLMLLEKPIPFKEHLYAGNILLAYLVGTLVTYIILLDSYWRTFPFGNGLEFDFLRYLNKVAILFFCGLFYTLGVWIDTLLMWHSEYGNVIYATYRFALLYDHAKFLAYLTIIPTAVLFIVYMETEFYDKYKQYYEAVRGRCTFAEIMAAKKAMVSLVYRHIVYLLERQLLITFTIIALSDYIFIYLGFSMLLRDIFRICALAALCNAIMLVVLLVLLYFEARKEAFCVSVMFFTANFMLTAYFIPLGTYFIGFGLFLAALCALLLSIVLLAFHLKKLTYLTFSNQPFFLVAEKGIFITIADHLNVVYCKCRPQKDIKYGAQKKTTELPPGTIK